MQYGIQYEIINLDLNFTSTKQSTSIRSNMGSVGILLMTDKKSHLRY